MQRRLRRDLGVCRERNGRRADGEEGKGRKSGNERGQRTGGSSTFSPSFNSLTKDGLINKSITHTRGAGGMNAYRVDKDRGEDVDKIGGCPRVLVVEQREARHGINVWPPRQNIHARLPLSSRLPRPIIASSGPRGPSPLSLSLFLHTRHFLPRASPMTVSGSTLKLSRTIPEN